MRFDKAITQNLITPRPIDGRWVWCCSVCGAKLSRWRDVVFACECNAPTPQGAEAKTSDNPDMHMRASGRGVGEK